MLMRRIYIRENTGNKKLIVKNRISGTEQTRVEKKSFSRRIFLFD